MTNLRDRIIEELGVKPSIDPRAEIDARVQFLADYLRSTPAKGFVLGISGSQAFARFTDSSTPVQVGQTTALTTGEWHFLVARIGDGRLTLFVDGEDAGGLTQCGTSTNISAVATWVKETAAGSADPASCSFDAGDSIVFKIRMTAKNDDSAFVSNLGFAYSIN